MRRVLSLAVLLAVTWPHLASMKCVATPHGTHSEHAEWVATHHAHDGPDCRALMACSSAMVEGSVQEEIILTPAPSSAYVMTAKAAPIPVDLGKEPPPPRRSA